MPNREQLPLTAEGFSRFHDAAHEHDDPEVRLIGQVLLHTGLRNGTCGHMHEDWIEQGPNGLQIRVPRQWPCTVGSGDSGCYYCGTDESRGPASTWRPKTDHGARVVPVASDFYDYHVDERRPIELPELLDDYFRLNEAIGASRTKVQRVVSDLAAEAGLEDVQGRGLTSRTFGDGTELYPDVIPHDLRGSWACQLVRADVNRFRARDWGGWSDVSMLNKYAKFVGGGDGSDREKY